MSRKILYIGNGKWCWTEQCSVHAREITLLKDYLTALETGDTKRSTALAGELARTEPGLAALRYQHVQELTQTLGRAPTVGLDLDNTSVDFTNSLREYTGTVLKVDKKQWLEVFPDPEEYRMWQGDNAWFPDSATFQISFQRAEMEGMYTSVKLYPQVTETLQVLKDYGINIKVVTARSQVFSEETLKYIRKKKLPGIEEVLHTGEEKDRIPDIDVYVEDAPIVIERLDKADKNVIIRTQAYNKGIPSKDNIERFDDWDADDVVSKVFRMMEQVKKRIREEER